MNKNLFRVLAPAAFLLFSSAALALDDFQVTGPITEKTESTITVMKPGKKKGDQPERFQIGISKDTKGLAEAKVGDTVRVKYKMNASSLEVLPPAKDAKPAKKK